MTLFLKRFIFYNSKLYVCVCARASLSVYLQVCLSAGTCTEVRRGRQNPWSYSCRQLRAALLSAGHQEEQSASLTAEPSPPCKCYKGRHRASHQEPLERSFPAAVYYYYYYYYYFLLLYLFLCVSRHYSAPCGNQKTTFRRRFQRWASGHQAWQHDSGHPYLLSHLTPPFTVTSLTS